MVTTCAHSFIVTRPTAFRDNSGLNKRTIKLSDLHEEGITSGKHERLPKSSRDTKVIFLCFHEFNFYFML